MIYFEQNFITIVINNRGNQKLMNLFDIKMHKRIFCAVLILLFTLANSSVCSAKGFSLSLKKNKAKTKTEKPAVEKPQVIKGEVEYSLEDCIEIALKNDPSIKIATTQKEIANSQVGLAKADYFPNITAGTGFTSQHNKNSGSSKNGGGFYNQGGSTSSSNNYYQLNLGVNQLIWNFGRTTASINMQKYNRESVIYDLENTVLNTVYRVKMAYFEALAAQANQDVYERSVSINKLNYERTNALFKEGLKSKIDVVNAHVYLTDAEISLVDAQGQLQNAIVNLNNAMYFPEAPEYTLKNTESFNFQKSKKPKNEVTVSYIQKNGSDELEQTAILTSGIEKQDIFQNYKFKPLILPVDEAISKAYENRPDLKSLLMVERAQKESLKAIKRSYMPELSASSGYNFRKNSDVANTGFNIGVSLDLPVINLMDIKYRVAQGQSYLKMAGENVELSKKNIFFEVKTNYVNMVMLQRKIPLMAQKVQQTLENFELADGRYTVGLGNFIELQQAQTNYNNAQLALVQAVFDYNVAKEQFQKSMGVR